MFRIVKKDGKKLNETKSRKWSKNVVSTADVDEIRVVDKKGVEHGIDLRKYKKPDVAGYIYHKVGYSYFGKRGLQNLPDVEREVGVVLKDGTIHYINVCNKCSRKKEFRGNVKEMEIDLSQHPVDEEVLI